MPSSGKREPTPDLGALLEGLLNAGVTFVLVGGLAAVVQGAPVATMDVDIVHQQTADNIDRLFAFLESIHAFYRRPDDKVLVAKKDDLAGKGHVLLTTRLGPLDVLAFIEEENTYEDLFNHTVEIAFRGHAIRVLTLKKLVEIKKNSLNAKDKQQLPVLEETLRQQEQTAGDGSC